MAPCKTLSKIQNVATFQQQDQVLLQYSSKYVENAPWIMRTLPLWRSNMCCMAFWGIILDTARAHVPQPPVPHSFCRVINFHNIIETESCILAQFGSTENGSIVCVGLTSVYRRYIHLHYRTYYIEKATTAILWVYVAMLLYCSYFQIHPTTECWADVWPVSSLEPYLYRYRIWSAFCGIGKSVWIGTYY